MKQWCPLYVFLYSYGKEVQSTNNEFSYDYVAND